MEWCLGDVIANSGVSSIHFLPLFPLKAVPAPLGERQEPQLIAGPTGRHKLLMVTVSAIVISSSSSNEKPKRTCELAHAFRQTAELIMRQVELLQTGETAQIGRKVSQMVVGQVLKKRSKNRFNEGMMSDLSNAQKEAGGS